MPVCRGMMDSRRLGGMTSDFSLASLASLAKEILCIIETSCTRANDQVDFVMNRNRKPSFRKGRQVLLAMSLCVPNANYVQYEPWGHPLYTVFTQVKHKPNDIGIEIIIPFHSLVSIIAPAKRSFIGLLVAPVKCSFAFSSSTVFDFRFPKLASWL